MSKRPEELRKTGSPLATAETFSSHPTLPDTPTVQQTYNSLWSTDLPHHGGYKQDTGVNMPWQAQRTVQWQGGVVMNK